MTEVLLAVLDQFDRRWSELLEDGFEAVAAEYRRRCFLTGRTVTIEQPGGRQVVGVCRGIDDDGLLLVRAESGELRVASGTVARWENR
jgi:biotin-(acetyl-CoA carboxylase) ligase